MLPSALVWAKTLEGSATVRTMAMVIMVRARAREAAQGKRGNAFIMPLL